MAFLRIIQQALRKALAWPVNDQDGKAALLQLASDFEIFLD